MQRPAILTILCDRTEGLHSYAVEQELQMLKFFRDQPPDYTGLYRLLKRMRRLLRRMGLEAIYPRSHWSLPGRVEHRVSLYWLRGVRIDHPSQVWSVLPLGLTICHRFAPFFLVWQVLTPKMGWSIGSVGSLCREGRIAASEGLASVLDAPKTRPEPASRRKGSKP